MTDAQKVEFLLDLLVDIDDALAGYVDIKDGSDGEPTPNFAMSISTSIAQAAWKCRRPSEPDIVRPQVSFPEGR